MANTTTDVLMIGAGIMSSTLAVMLKELDPDLNIDMYETLASEAQESSNAWNNAGTGHAALCEMNYTPQNTDGSIDISKALEVNVEFDLSRQLWSYLIKKNAIKDPELFIHPVPHHSFVNTPDNIAFLKKRFEALTAHHCFKGMLYSEDKQQIQEWAPLVMEGRNPSEQVAMTRMPIGTDVDYGALTKNLLDSLKGVGGFSVHFSNQVTDLKRDGKQWRVRILDKVTGERKEVLAQFVFIGAGGGALTLLEKSGIPQVRNFAGFPVSGNWLRCDNPEICNRHFAKVYGKASVGSPPMSVPHLDLRHIDGKISLLFGPFAGFSTKFLKNGSYFDFFRSINFHNILPLIEVGWKYMNLTEYLIGQVMETEEERQAALQEYFPNAKPEDWKAQVAGQRVQIIERNAAGKAILKFGTKLVQDDDKSIIALLGASPGASTAVAIMVQVIERCFADKLNTTVGMAKMKMMIPSYGQSLINDGKLCRQIRDETAETLKIEKQSN